MTRTTLITAASLIAALAVPAAAIASPNATDKHNAKTACASERGSTSATHEAFDLKFAGKSADDSTARRRCIVKTSKEQESERHAARSTARKSCTAEHGTTAAAKQSFDDKFAPKGSDDDAMRACIVAESKSAKSTLDRQKRKGRIAEHVAAQTCDTERGDSTSAQDAFEQKFGATSSDDAFENCVTQTETENEANDTPGTEPETNDTPGTETEPNHTTTTPGKPSHA